MAEWIALAELATRPRPGRSVTPAPHGEHDHAAFRAAVARWRTAFAAQPGTRWALHFEDAVEFAAALFGAWHAGKQAWLCADALPDTLARLAAEVDGLAGDFPAGSAALALHRERPLPAPDGDDGAAWPALDERATRLVVFTSGSTGAASAIDKRLAQLAREVEALEATFGARLGDAVVQGTVSHQHIYGLLFRVLWPLAAGRRIAPRLFFHEELLAGLRGPALLVSSPAHLKRLPEGQDWPPARRHLRALFSSGGALPAAAADAAHHAFGQAVLEIYGSSETGGVAWREHGEDGGTWQALPGVAWRVVDEQLEIASPHLAQAGWWRSSDRAQTEGAGFRLLGRADRIVKVEERRVSLDALERQLLALPDVAEARVLLLEGTRAELAAVVVPGNAAALPRSTGERRELAQRLGQALAGGQDAVTRPRRWRFVEALPANAQGKTSDAALRALFRPLLPAPQWLQRTPRQARLELQLDPSLAVFDGHFPQLPILPGIAQLDWAVRFGREAFALPAHFLRVEALKFQQVARPGLCIGLHLEWQAERATLAFRYESAHGAHARGRVVFAAGGA